MTWREKPAPFLAGTDGQDEVLVAVGDNAPVRAVREVRTCLAAVAVNMLVSNSEAERPRPPAIVVVIDGWGSQSLLDAVQSLQRLFPNLPILAVIARDSAAIPTVLEAGASACVQWPLACDELLARLRSSSDAHRVPVVLDTIRQTLDCDGVHASLTRGEIRILRALLREPDRWISSKELMEVALGSKRTDTTQVRVHVHAIRRKLQHQAWRLRGDRALGYFFVALRIARHPKP